MDSDNFTSLPEQLAPTNQEHHDLFHMPIVTFFGLVIMVVALFCG